MQDGAIPMKLEGPPAQQQAAAPAAAGAGGGAAGGAAPAAGASSQSLLGAPTGAGAPLPSTLSTSNDSAASGGAQAMDLDPPAPTTTQSGTLSTPAAVSSTAAAASGAMGGSTSAAAPPSAAPLGANGTHANSAVSASPDPSQAAPQEPPATKAEQGQDEDSQRRSELGECRKLLDFLTSRGDAAPFVQPVDWKTLGLPDYPTIIKHPMDLGSIGTKLGSSKYDNAWEFANDVRLVWKNAMTYNQVRSPIYNIAEKLMRLFERKFDKIVKAPKQEPDSDVSDIKAATVQDRIRFATLAKALNSEQLAVVIEMIESRCPNALNESDDELEIEVYHIDAKSLREINDYAESCVGDPAPKKSK